MNHDRRTRMISLWTLILSMLFAVFAFSVQAQSEGFSEEFDDPGLPGWTPSSGVSTADGFVHLGPGNFLSRYGEWEDIQLSARIKREGDGDVVISYQSGGGSGYHLVVGRNRLLSQREFEGTLTEMASAQRVTVPAGKWFQIEIITLGGDHQFLLDGNLVLESYDPDPLPPHGIAIETLANVTLDIDSVMLVSEGKPPPEDEVLSELEPEKNEIEGLPALPWVYTGGPSGGLGYDIRMDPRNPDVMYVTDAHAGAFKSLDGGVNWFPINSGITARVGLSGDSIPVFSLTVDPNNPDILWAGTQFGGGCYRSDDGGQTWQSMSQGIIERGLTIRGFTVQPGNSDVVYLAGEISSWEWNGTPLQGIAFDLTRGAVYKTTDRGQNWTRIWYGDNLARYVIIHPDDPNLLYVSTGIFDREAANSNPKTLEPGGIGVLRSTDGGITWEELGVNNGFRADELYIGSLAMHPTDSKILFAAAGSDAHLYALNRPLGAIYRSLDGGDQWERVLELSNASSVEICESDPDVVYAGAASWVYRSDDGGSTWQLVNGIANRIDQFWGPENVVAGFPIDMQCDPNNPLRIFVNNYGGGNVLSDDGGLNWINSSNGYSGALMDMVVAAPGNPGMVLASARSGIFKSIDGGETWEGMSRNAARAMEANAIAVNPQDLQHLIVVVTDTGPIPKISYDGGSTWTRSTRKLTNTEDFTWYVMKKIEFNPVIPGRVIGIQGESKCSYGASCDQGFGVIYSSDGGENWTWSDLNQGVATELIIGSNGTAYVSIFPADLYRSNDGGGHWELVSSEIDSAFDIQNRDPDLPGPALISLAVDPIDDSKLYAGFSRAGVLVSTDGGVSWTPSSSGMMPETSVFDLAADSAHPGVVYAASIDSGVYRSIDGGKSWTTMNSGLLNRAGVRMWLSEDGSVLYLATEGAGVFRLTPDGNPPTDQGLLGEGTSQDAEDKMPATTDSDSQPNSTGGSVLSRQNQTELFAIAVGFSLVVVVVVVLLIIRRRR